LYFFASLAALEHAKETVTATTVDQIFEKMTRAT
jgi:hypothetical protein